MKWGKSAEEKQKEQEEKQRKQENNEKDSGYLAKAYQNLKEKSDHEVDKTALEETYSSVMTNYHIRGNVQRALELEIWQGAYSETPNALYVEFLKVKSNAENVQKTADRTGEPFNKESLINAIKMIQSLGKNSYLPWN